MVHAVAGLVPFQIAFVVHDLERAGQRFDDRWQLLHFRPVHAYGSVHSCPSVRVVIAARDPVDELGSPRRA